MKIDVSTTNHAYFELGRCFLNEVEIKLLREHLTCLISSHTSVAVIICEVPDIEKDGHSDTWTSSVSWAEIAKVTGGRPFTVLNKYNAFQLDHKSMDNTGIDQPSMIRNFHHSYLWCRSTLWTPSCILQKVVKTSIWFSQQFTDMDRAYYKEKLAK